MSYLFCFVLSAVFAYSSAGLFRDVLYSNWITCNHDKFLNYGVSEVQIFFYDFQNNFNLSFPIEFAVEGITSSYNLDITRRLIFFNPGYKSHISKNTEELVRQTFSDVPNIYLIIVDHSMYTSAKGGKFASYERSVRHVYYIGTAIGNFLAGLQKQGFPSNNIHCIGHSLGSQMLGYAGTRFTELTNEKIWRITGLDPAGPCFSNGSVEDQIRSGVANYVEVYHCNAGGLGTTSVLGDIDFFFNKAGKKQPTCHSGIIPGKGESDAAKCSHKACVRYYTESVHLKTGYLAWACDSYDHYSKGSCSVNQVTIAGYNNPGNVTGTFYVSTDMFGV
ncbi:unnamed protein product [Arctia plantaginis]|uniref:Lipase domain-containing protein n=1 Tax=Arctia plantaginis TaxID=874455 RepID=A0A8S1B093_ARCPL|nr:unnamed protein product [Arctia plantaginis]